MKSALELFEAKVTPDPNTGCWIWTAFVCSTSGYGFMKYKGRTWTAHRVAHELFKGPIPDGLEVDHLCRNRWCANPGHLEAVTTSENLRRRPYCRVKLPMAAEIRRLYPLVGSAVLAERFGVSRREIQYVVKGERLAG